MASWLWSAARVSLAHSATVLARHTQIHHAQLTSHLTPGNALLREQLVPPCTP